MSSSKSQWNSLAALRDSADSRDLWETIFTEDSPAFLDYYDTWKVKENRIETRRAGGRLVSMVHWNPYRVWMKEEMADSYYVIAVATLPEYRHRGLMAGQLRDGMRDFRKEGVPFVFLMPASPDIYTPFDFRYIWDRRVVTVKAAEGQLPGDASGEPKPEIRPLRVAEWNDAASLMRYRLADHFPCCTVRDRAYVERTAWECRSEGGDVEGIFLDGSMIGVLSWWGDEKIEIREMILAAEWEPKADCVLAALRDRWPEAEEITCISAGWEAGDAQREPIIMARIVDLASFLKVMTSPEEQQICIRVEDRYLPENDGLFCWRTDAGGSSLERVTEGREEIRISIADLTTWLMGYGEIEDTDAVMTPAGQAFAAAVQGIKACFFPEIV